MNNIMKDRGYSALQHLPFPSVGPYQSLARWKYQKGSSDVSLGSMFTLWHGRKLPGPREAPQVF